MEKIEFDSAPNAKILTIQNWLDKILSIQGL